MLALRKRFLEETQIRAKVDRIREKVELRKEELIKEIDEQRYQLQGSPPESKCKYLYYYNYNYNYSELIS